jgi:hypothetical protein
MGTGHRWRHGQIARSAVALHQVIRLGVVVDLLRRRLVSVGPARQSVRSNQREAALRRPRAGISWLSGPCFCYVSDQSFLLSLLIGHNVRMGCLYAVIFLLTVCASLSGIVLELYGAIEGDLPMSYFVATTILLLYALIMLVYQMRQKAVQDELKMLVSGREEENLMRQAELAEVQEKKDMHETNLLTLSQRHEQSETHRELLKERCASQEHRLCALTADYTKLVENNQGLSTRAEYLEGQVKHLLDQNMKLQKLLDMA